MKKEKQAFLPFFRNILRTRLSYAGVLPGIAKCVLSPEVSTPHTWNVIMYVRMHYAEVGTDSSSSHRKGVCMVHVQSTNVKKSRGANMNAQKQDK